MANTVLPVPSALSWKEEPFVIWCCCLRCRRLLAGITQALVRFSLNEHNCMPGVLGSEVRRG